MTPAEQFGEDVNQRMSLSGGSRLRKVLTREEEESIREAKESERVDKMMYHTLHLSRLTCDIGPEGNNDIEGERRSPKEIAGTGWRKKLRDSERIFADAIHSGSKRQIGTKRQQTY